MAAKVARAIPNLSAPHGRDQRRPGFRIIGARHICILIEKGERRIYRRVRRRRRSQLSIDSLASIRLYLFFEAVTSGLLGCSEVSLISVRDSVTLEFIFYR